ncbi:MAG: phosphoribosylanthranilate isomerase [Pseudomonadota bacterium]
MTATARPPIQVKICGIKDQAAANAAAAACADYVGINSYPRSPRYLPVEQVAPLIAPLTMPVVGVVVDGDDDLLTRLVAAGITIIQAHGAEDPARCADIQRRFAVPVIKAVAINHERTVDHAFRDYAQAATMLLFDTPRTSPQAMPGGSGQPANWDALAQGLKQARTPALPWFLAGGLTAETLPEAVTRTGARMVDVASGVERTRGMKDPALITQFIERARALG